MKCSSDCLANSLTCLSKKEEFFLRKTKNSFNSICPDKPLHSALKLEKKCNFKSAKKHYLHFQKWQKINFCTRKKFKTTKNAIFGLKKTRIFGSFKLFSGTKLDFCHFWIGKKCVFVLLKLQFFSNFRTLCIGCLCLKFICSLHIVDDDDAFDFVANNSVESRLCFGKVCVVGYFLKGK